MLLHVLLLLLSLVCINGDHPSEREALTHFKSTLLDHANGLSSWSSPDCCSWAGIACDSASAHVVRLDLHNLALTADHLDNTLLSLIHLRYLDLSLNTFKFARFPAFIGNFTDLRYLNFSNAGFSGAIPINLNITLLTHLDLSTNHLGPDVPSWIFKQPNLQHLDLSRNPLRATFPASLQSLDDNNINHPETLANLCQLKKLRLDDSELDPDALTKLAHTLSNDCVNGSLEELSMVRAGLASSFPNSLWTLKTLKRLDLSFNSLHGSINIPQLDQTSLQELSIVSNKLNGTLTGMGELINLTHLDLCYNSLTGVVTESNFTNLQRLQKLEITRNSLQMMVRYDWVPPFQLDFIGLGFCRLGPRFPAWLSTQHSLTHVDLSYNSIDDRLPDWFWNLTSRASYLDLSHNNITGELPVTLEVNSSISTLYFDFRSNRLEGRIPRFPSKAIVVDLSDNLLYGTIPEILNSSSLAYFSVSMNRISGGVPKFLCQAKEMSVLDLSWNYLTGEIPGCWNKSLLSNLDLSENRFTGRIPEGMGTLSSLEQMSLRSNGLEGVVPESLKNCRELITLDLGNNKLSGNIPSWIGEETLTRLVVLVLRSNKFIGTIPPQLSNLSYLKVLDLARNKLSGSIPRSFGNFSSMISIPKPGREGIGMYSQDNILLVMKGRELTFRVLLASIPISIDLSDNNLTGQIPEEIINLLAMQSLNLSMNFFTGQIKTRIGELNRLESLDLSRNRLSGEIPSSLSGLNFLARLNLSYNELHGAIPAGNQLQTLDDPTIYMGNPDLCGHPLTKNCTSDGGTKDTETESRDEEEDDDDGKEWLYGGIGTGFAVGISVVCGVLAIKERPRSVSFRFADCLHDGLCNLAGKRNWVVGWALFLCVFVSLAALWNWVWR